MNDKEVSEHTDLYCCLHDRLTHTQPGQVKGGTPGRQLLVKMKSVQTLLFVLLLVDWLSGQTVLDQGKPLIQEIYVPRQLKQAKSVRLSCGTIQGELPMMFSWFFNNVQITGGDQFQRSNFIIRTADTSSDLIIRSLSIDNIGRYSCSSSNKHGTDTQNVSIQFEGKSF